MSKVLTTSNNTQETSAKCSPRMYQRSSILRCFFFALNARQKRTPLQTGTRLPKNCFQTCYTETITQARSKRWQKVTATSRPPMVEDGLGKKIKLLSKSDDVFSTETEQYTSEKRNQKMNLWSWNSAPKQAIWTSH